MSPVMSPVMIPVMSPVMSDKNLNFDVSKLRVGVDFLTKILHTSYLHLLTSSNKKSNFLRTSKIAKFSPGPPTMNVKYFVAFQFAGIKLIDHFTVHIPKSGISSTSVGCKGMYQFCFTEWGGDTI